MNDYVPPQGPTMIAMLRAAMEDSQVQQNQTIFATAIPAPQEQILKHTGKQLYTGKHIKFCHLPVHTDNRLYWQDMFVLYWHRTIFQPYWQDRIYSVSYGICYPVIMHGGALRHARQYCIAQ